MPEPFLDTNVLVYVVDDAEPAKQAVARRLLQEHPRAVISTQVMLEWFNVVTRRLQQPLSVTQALEGLRALERMDVRSTHPELVVAAAALVTSSQLSLWDAMVVEAAARAGCTTLLTEDLNAGQTIQGVQVVNPFA